MSYREYPGADTRWHETEREAEEGPGIEYTAEDYDESFGDDPFHSYDPYDENMDGTEPKAPWDDDFPDDVFAALAEVDEETGMPVSKED